MIPNINPQVDYAFKHLLGRDATRPILIAVVNSVLNHPALGRRIRSLDLLNPFNPKESFDDKLTVLDIKARDQDGWQLNIEMQIVAHRFFDRRSLYYLTKFHTQQLHEGHDYVEVRPTILMVFLNGVLFPEAPAYHLRFRMLETDSHFPFSNDLELHLLELPKFNKSAEELTSELDIWLYFLRHAEKMDLEAMPPALQQRPLVLRAMEELMKLSQDDLERERYESRLKAQRDYNAGMMDAELRGAERALEQGIEIGLDKGEMVAEIRARERQLNRPQTPREKLRAMSLEELTRIADELQAQLPLG
jgi:predicted transposase/invertase (TIGR01784 family)